MASMSVSKTDGPGSSPGAPATLWFEMAWVERWRSVSGLEDKGRG